MAILKTFYFTLWVLSLTCESLPITAFDRTACQLPTTPALSGCPAGTIFVSGSDPAANFTSLQSAILSLPSDTAETILLGAGTYQEQINVTRPGPLTILGQTFSPKSRTENLATVQWASAVINGSVVGSPHSLEDNAFTAVLTVAPTLDSSLTGAGPTGFAVPDDTPFGSTDFRAYNVDWSNNFAEYAAGQSLALSLSRANGGFYWNRFLSYQDTIYVGKLGNAYFYENEVAGTTDFFYGFGTAFINSSLITLRSCGGGVTAWKGTNTTFENKYGVYITSSQVQKANSSLEISEHCALGRPWNSQHRSLFFDTELDDSIQPSGYSDWIDAGVSRVTNLTMMAESGSFGPGWNETGRIDGGLDILLTAEQAAAWNTPLAVFQTPNGTFGQISWIDTDP